MSLGKVILAVEGNINYRTAFACHFEKAVGTYDSVYINLLVKYFFSLNIKKATIDLALN